MPNPLDILKKYWNHTSFRPLQEEIIESVLQNNDTFALLPTGGGKSICFQVPALVKEGICIVVSPLIALMKDQIKNLNAKGIKAIALTGGIPENEIIELLDNCQYGNYKFLYLSPERLQNDWIIERIKQLKINLIAIDEAHCISQWGHDFRPAYTKLATLKKMMPKVPFIALTASATPQVQQDIVTQLELNTPKIYKKSFQRDNLAYLVYSVEDKYYFLQKILHKHPNPSIVYVTNRKACVEFCNMLNKSGISATYYHGGLNSKEKEQNMTNWLQEKNTVMVATNAFGMGIDKPNVKTVIHLHLPSNLESYYQEAGRAGRNEEKAYAVLLYNKSDIIQSKTQFIDVLPNKEYLKTVFIKLCNFFQIAYGEGIDESFSFNLQQFCIKYNLPILKTYNAIQFLDRQGVLNFNQKYAQKVLVQFTVPSKEIIRYTSIYPNEEEIVLGIVRNYSGIYENKIALNTLLIAKKANSTEEQVVKVLKNMQQRALIELDLFDNDAIITFLEIREDDSTVNRLAKILKSQNELKIQQFESVLSYITNNTACKNKLLMAYFGETVQEDCKICSYCLQKNQKQPNFTVIETKILELLFQKDLSSREMQEILKISKDNLIFALQNLLEQEKIVLQTSNTYTVNK
ncbi:ATP-dependent DNA helicase RecQ [Flavobacterium croceum DSM 17960]|uniref:ATP-dependent DNA helicase RecQ n=1 Tax=Flavobacterium croceum DSM 17960 TaxID=1121886 RepID=A0A2S4N8W5_9FLAO|nr:ATP-dependent DNA helicase RecQ [Flavobacterium croceum]POS02137.1 ATP-dependent DNA helicase RecQ [Flavobacterium croceum DSM 17960]